MVYKKQSSQLLFTETQRKLSLRQSSNDIYLNRSVDDFNFEDGIHQTGIFMNDNEKSEKSALNEWDSPLYQGQEPTFQPKKQPWKKPKGMPKRPLSSYNLYFQLERERILQDDGNKKEFTAEDVERIICERKLLDSMPKARRKHRKTHGKLSFRDMARVIANSWKALPPSQKRVFYERAAVEKRLYKEAVKAWSLSKLKSDSSNSKSMDGFSGNEMQQDCLHNETQYQNNDHCIQTTSPEDFHPFTCPNSAFIPPVYMPIPPMYSIDRRVIGASLSPYTVAAQVIREGNTLPKHITVLLPFQLPLYSD